MRLAAVKDNIVKIIERDEDWMGFYNLGYTVVDTVSHQEINPEGQKPINDYELLLRAKSHLWIKQ